jgi:hypothetical protein
MLRRALNVTTLLASLLGIGLSTPGCLDRPISSNDPTTKTNFTTVQQITSVDKVDLLFDIDNSQSMGDKQFYLEQAVPDLVNRLINPQCVNLTTGQSPGSSAMGSCAAFPGTQLEFPPVHDLHIGIISSSLGTRGVTGTIEVDGEQYPRYVCNPEDPFNQQNVTLPLPYQDGGVPLPTHVDDRGELLNRTATNAYQEGVSADEGAEHFLDWFPQAPANLDTGATAGISPPGPVLTPTATPLGVAGGLGTTGTLEGDFGQLVEGVHAYGCGIESQLESWYRFLIQPDPYDSIQVVNGSAVWEGVDKTILQQRHDFLRPDSLVAVIVLSDENDSEIDVRSVGGKGYLFMDQTWTPPRGTSACNTDPNSPDCQSCGADGTSADPNCKLGDYPASPGNDPGFYINVRHVRMKQKYGFSPQYPLQRYVLGLTSARVPDRDHEYPPGQAWYQGGTQGDPQDLSCLNPLFAASLPDGSDLTPTALCNATGAVGPRPASLVFYAHIGGVPHELLQVDPTDPSSPQKDTLAQADWVKILGAGAAGTSSNPFDYMGIDPHMVEAFDPPRTATAYNTNTTETIVTGAPPALGGGSDPINGRDWVTDSMNPAHELPVDREYACIFQLADTEGNPTPRDCSQGEHDPLDYYACDCETPGLAPDAVPPVCGLPHPTQAYAEGSNDYTTQYYAKAYPTIRELTLAQMMGEQGVISSLCPIHVQDESTPGHPDEVFGYRPAITAIVGRLKKVLAAQCLPQPLDAVETPDGLQVPCLVLASLPNTHSGDESAVCNPPGLSVPDPKVLANFDANQHAQWLLDTTTTDLSTLATCEVNQIHVPAGQTCVTPGATEKGWCYVTGAAAGECDTQAILYTPNSTPNGAIVNLQCILANQ